MLVENNGKYKINTPEGYVDFVGIEKSNIPLEIFEIITENGIKLECTAKHIFVIDGIEKYACEFLPGHRLQRKDGKYEIVKFADYSGNFDFVYDIVGVNNKTYTFFANGIVSHNCNFLGSSQTLIDAEMLERISTIDPILYEHDYKLAIYERPERGISYVIGVDSGKGIGSDYSVAQVLKINSHNDIKQVAVFRDNEVSYHRFSQILIGIAEYYNDAMLMIENNEAGMGSQIAETIWYEFDYGNIVNLDKKGLGVRSSRTTKLAANMALKRYIENGWLEILDAPTLYELSRYEEVKPDIFKASGKGNDDCVTSLIWGIYYLTTDMYDGKDIEVKKISKENKISDSDGPIMMFDDNTTSPIQQGYSIEDFYSSNGDFSVF